jgi:hypothetical protein
MARRETILRDDNDGGLRQHEVEIRTYSARAEGKEELILDAESWYRAREQARMAFGTEHVTVEEVVEGITRLTGDVVVGSGYLQAIASAPAVPLPEPEPAPASIESIPTKLIDECFRAKPNPAPSSALERLQRRARGQ